MDVIERKPMRRTREDIEALRIIRRCGFICRESNGDPWVSTGHAISASRFERLLKMGLLEPKGDSLFGGPSQTYIPVEEKHVQACLADSHSDKPG